MFFLKRGENETQSVAENIQIGRWCGKIKGRKGNVQLPSCLIGVLPLSDLANNFCYSFFFSSASNWRIAWMPSLQAHGPLMQPPGHAITSIIFVGHLPDLAYARN